MDGMTAIVRALILLTFFTESNQLMTASMGTDASSPDAAMEFKYTFSPGMATDAGHTQTPQRSTRRVKLVRAHCERVNRVLKRQCIGGLRVGCH